MSGSSIFLSNGYWGEGGKQLAVWHSPPTAEVKNKWSYTYTLCHHWLWQNRFYHDQGLHLQSIMFLHKPNNHAKILSSVVNSLRFTIKIISTANPQTDVITDWKLHAGWRWWSPVECLHNCRLLCSQTFQYTQNVHTTFWYHNIQ